MSHDVTRKYLTTKELAERWRCSHRTIEGWRDRGIGPSFVRVRRRVLYPLAAIEKAEQAWEKSAGDLAW